MKKTGNEIELSASDVSNHIACLHLTNLDLDAAHGFIEAPKFYDQSLALMIERGITRTELEDNITRVNSWNVEKIKHFIIKGKALLKMTDSTRSFNIVKNSPEVVKARKKGKQYFLNHFFDKAGYLKTDIPKTADLSQIIEVLFNWNILFNEADGDIYVDKKRFCQK